MEYTQYTINYHDIYFYFSKFHSDENTNTPKGKYWETYYKPFNCDFLITAIDGDDSMVVSTHQKSLENRNSVSFLASEYINPSFMYFSPIGINDKIFDPREKGFESLMNFVSSYKLSNAPMIVCKKYLRRIVFSMLANTNLWDRIFKIGRPYTQLLFRIDYKRYYSGKSKPYCLNKMLFDDFIFIPSYDRNKPKRGMFSEVLVAKHSDKTISEITFIDNSDLKFSFTDVYPFKSSGTISKNSFNEILSARITSVIKNSLYTNYFLSTFSSTVENNRITIFPHKKRFIGFDNYFFDYEKIMNDCKEVYVRL